VWALACPDALVTPIAMLEARSEVRCAEEPTLVKGSSFALQDDLFNKEERYPYAKAIFADGSNRCHRACRMRREQVASESNYFYGDFADRSYDCRGSNQTVHGHGNN